MNKNVFILLIVLIILSVSVTAPGTIITNTGSDGYDIETTPFAYMMLGQNFTANFHVFNKSSGMPLSNTTIRCNLHIYNHNGEHILEEDNIPYNIADMEWELYLNSNNFSQTGLFSWIVYCNSSVYGGFRSEVFAITDDGLDILPNVNAGIPIILFMLFGIIGLFILGFIGKFNKHEIVNLVLKRGCIVTAIMLMMYTVTLLSNIVSYANLTVLTKEMLFLMEWIGWAGYVGSVYLVIQTLFDILSLKKKKKDKDVYEVSD